MADEINWFVKNGLGVLLVFASILGIVMLISLNNIEMNPKNNRKLMNVVTIETMENKHLPDYDTEYKEVTEDSHNSFCKDNMKDGAELEKKCNKLPSSTCKNMSCCVLANDTKKCLAGDAHGPTFRTDTEGKLITVDTYYYMKKCYGQNCPN